MLNLRELISNSYKKLELHSLHIFTCVQPLLTFTIKHYAGEVVYESNGFIEKNKDTLYDDLIEVMQMSNLPLMVSWFPEDTKQTQKKRPTTAGFKLKSSAQALMANLSKCSPHYIRCMKPNENKAYHDWDAKRVQHQVQYLGLLENVRVRRAGFAYRAEFARFLKRYKKLCKKTWGMWGGMVRYPHCRHHCFIR